MTHPIALVGEDVGQANRDRMRAAYPAIEFRFCPTAEAFVREAGEAEIWFSKRFPPEAIERAGRRGMLVVFTDLFDASEDMLSSLKMIAARGHEVTVIQVLDPDEIEFPFEDPHLFESMEDDRSVLTFPREVRQAYLQEMQTFLDTTRRALAESGITHELARTDEPPHQPLLRWLSGRRARPHTAVP